MKYLTGNSKEARKLCEALGINPDLTMGFTLKVYAGEDVRLEVETLVPEGVAGDLISIFEEFKLQMQ